jgi:hypothetical protein
VSCASRGQKRSFTSSFAHILKTLFTSVFCTSTQTLTLASTCVGRDAWPRGSGCGSRCLPSLTCHPSWKPHLSELFHRKARRQEAHLAAAVLGRDLYAHVAAFVHRPEHVAVNRGGLVHLPHEGPHALPSEARDCEVITAEVTTTRDLITPLYNSDGVAGCHCQTSEPVPPAFRFAEERRCSTRATSLPDSFNAASSSVRVVIGGGAAAAVEENARRGAASPSLPAPLRINDAIRHQ